MTFEETVQAHTAALNRYCDVVERLGASQKTEGVTTPTPASAAEVKKLAYEGKLDLPASADDIELKAVQAKLAQVSTTLSNAEAFAVVESFGVEKASQIPVEQYARAIALCDQALAGAAA